MKITSENQKVGKTSEISSRTSFSTSFSNKSKGKQKALNRFSETNPKANQKDVTKIKNRIETQVSKKNPLRSRKIKLTDENTTKPTSVDLDSDKAPRVQIKPQLMSPKKSSFRKDYSKISDVTKDRRKISSSQKSQVSADVQKIPFADKSLKPEKNFGAKILENPLNSPNPKKSSTSSKFDRMTRLGSFKNHKARLKRAESVTKDEIDKPLVKKKITLEEYLKEESRIRHNLKFD